MKLTLEEKLTDLIRQTLRQLPRDAPVETKRQALQKRWEEYVDKRRTQRKRFWDEQVELYMQPPGKVEVTDDGVRCSWCNNRPGGCAACYNARQSLENGSPTPRKDRSP
jgi:hypothetical protein